MKFRSYQGIALKPGISSSKPTLFYRSGQPTFLSRKISSSSPTPRASFNLSDKRAITVASGGGSIFTNGSTTIAQAITGVGKLSVKRRNSLTLTRANSYTGGATIDEGQLQIGTAVTS